METKFSISPNLNTREGFRERHLLSWMRIMATTCRRVFKRRQVSMENHFFHKNKWPITKWFTAQGSGTARSHTWRKGRNGMKKFTKKRPNQNYVPIWEVTFDFDKMWLKRCFHLHSFSFYFSLFMGDVNNMPFSMKKSDGKKRHNFALMMS